MAIYSADLALSNSAILSIDAAFVFEPMNHHQRLFTLHLGALDLSHSVTAVSGRISDNGVYLQATIAGGGADRSRVRAPRPHLRRWPPP